MADVPELPVRRPPPPFRRVTVVRTARQSPDLLRLTLGGAELAGFVVEEPAASCRLLLPDPGSDVELPAWNGNEFLRADGRRARIRTLTPVRVDAGANELDVDVVLHDDSPLTVWATTAEPGSSAAVSGPGAGYPVAGDAPVFLVVGDESAIPAIGTLLPALPGGAEVVVIVEVRRLEAAIDLPEHRGATVRWCAATPDGPPGSAMVDAVAETLAERPLPPGARVWAAGEAAAVQRLRGLLADAGVPRAATHVRGYWKHGREGT